MRFIAINGSPRKEGNTYHALMGVGKQLEESGIDFQILQIDVKAMTFLIEPLLIAKGLIYRRLRCRLFYL